MRRIIASLAAASMLLSFESSAGALFPGQQQANQVRSVKPESLEDKLKTIKDHSNEQLVTENDIEEYRKNRIDLKKVLDIASLKRDGKSVFCRDYFRDYVLGGGTYAHAFSVVKSADETNSAIDETIKYSWSNKNPSDTQCKTDFPAIKKELEKIVDKDGRKFYRFYESLKEYCNSKITASQVMSIARGVLDEGGFPFFKGEEIIAYAAAGGNVKYAKAFREKFNLGSNDLIHLKEVDADVKGFSRFVAETGLDASSAAYYFALGINRADKFHFTDTSKPNAFIVYANYDPDGAQRNEAERQTLEKLRGAYDLKVSVVAKRSELYDAAKEIPDIMLFGMNGHSSGNELRLGSNRIAAKDAEMRDILAGLHPNASIYFGACLGREFADQIVTLAGGRKVFSPNGLMRSSSVQIESLVPFNIKFYEGARDITIVQN